MIRANYLFFVLLVSCFFQTNSQETQTHWMGTASYYHSKFNGRRTTCGEIFNNDKLTAANNFLKFGTRVKVINLKNEKSVIVTINDRMHGRNKRLIDLTQAAAKELGFFDQGTCEVRVELIRQEK